MALTTGSSPPSGSTTLPKLDVSRFRKLKAKLDNGDLLRFVGHKLDGNDIAAMAGIICKALPPNVKFAHVEDSCRSYVGMVFDGAALAALTSAMAGNVAALIKNPVPRWTRQLGSEWVSAQIIDVAPDIGFKKDRGFTFRFWIISGSAAGEMALKFWSVPAMRFAAKVMGFNRKLPFHISYQLVGLYLQLQLDPAFSSAKPGFRYWNCSKPTQTKNRKIAKLRLRTFNPCPRELTIACHVCPIGYVDCPFACHPRTFQQYLCESCGQDGYFDVVDVNAPLGKCLHCSGGGR